MIYYEVQRNFCVSLTFKDFEIILDLKLLYKDKLLNS